MEAFIQETLRFNCSVPGMWRNTAQDATYEVIHLNIIILHHHLSDNASEKETEESTTDG
jgi:hypothetical protein